MRNMPKIVFWKSEPYYAYMLISLYKKNILSLTEKKMYGNNCHLRVLQLKLLGSKWTFSNFCVYNIRSKSL